jgi:alpha-galactosidase
MRSKFLLNLAGCVGSLLLSTSHLIAEAVPLSTLDLKQMTSGWGVPKADRAIGGGQLRIAGKEFAHGVGTHANSLLRVDLGGNARRFQAKVGVNDTAETQGSVEFLVIGDNKQLWRSGVLKRGQEAKSVDVNLAGVKVLTLRVTDGGDGESNDHADWAEAQIVMADGAPKPIVLPPHESFQVRTKNFSLQFQVGDDGRLYQREVGGNEAGKLTRNEEAFPQSGDGYIWEPALQVTHADGNTSTVSP